MARALFVAVVTALVAAAAATAAPSNFAQYRVKVNRLCRSYTPTFKKLEADMADAKRAGDVHRYAYDFGKILGVTLAQGLRIEKIPVPADGRTRMAPTLRLLHAADAQLRRAIQAATSGDADAFKTQLTKLAKVASPLNHRFDSVGLQDCGSRQS